jgi:hypothetical protein
VTSPELWIAASRRSMSALAILHQHVSRFEGEVTLAHDGL